MHNIFLKVFLFVAKYGLPFEGIIYGVFAIICGLLFLCCPYGCFKRKKNSRNYENVEKYEKFVKSTPEKQILKIENEMEKKSFVKKNEIEVLSKQESLKCQTCGKYFETVVSLNEHMWNC